MAYHELKTNHEVFIMAWRGDKPFEIRFDDREYMVGDFVLLKETVYSYEEMKNGKPLAYTGRALSRQITSVVGGYGLMEGYVVLGLKNV